MALGRRRGALAALTMLLAAGSAEARLHDPVVFTLANGLTVAVVSNFRAPVATVMVWYAVGAADDPAGKSGLAHYLEHLMFKGTEVVGPGGFARAIEAEGGRFNAATSPDATVFFETVAADRLALVLRLEADRMAHLKIEPATAVPELAVVEEERRLTVDSVPSALLDEQMAPLLHPRHPYGIPVIGRAAELHRLTAADAASFYRARYAPNAAVLVVAGAIDALTVRELAEATFGTIPARPAAAQDRPIDPPRRGPLRARLDSPQLQQPRWRRAYPAPGYRQTTADDVAALTVLTAVLGDEPDGLLYRALVDDGGLATRVGVSYQPARRDGTELVLAASLAPGVAVERLEAAVDGVLQRLAADGPPPELVDRARQALAVDFLYARDSLAAAADGLGRALATGGTVDQVEGAPGRIAAVTPGSVRAAAARVLDPDAAVTGIALPAPAP